MKILNFGSMNIDFVFNVDHIVISGETISSSEMNTFPGGKGLNQSIALARAGAKVYHAGMIGEDGLVLLELLEKEGVNCDNVKIINEKTGTAFIQVDHNGQNSIIVYGGANRKITEQYIDNVLRSFDDEDIILLQNEISNIDYIIKKSFEKEMKIVFNPSPVDDKLLQYDLNKISIFILNQYEGSLLSENTSLNSTISILKKKYPYARIVITQGSEGVIYLDNKNIYKHGAYNVNVVDTTAAGDTFAGYFLALFSKNIELPEVLELSSKAAALTVTRKGAAHAIPYLNEVIDIDISLL